MNPSTPPDRLSELAERLSRRWIEPPSAELAARVLKDVAEQLPATRSKNSGASWPVFAAALAAAFVIATSLSLIAVSDTRAAPGQPVDPQRQQATARAIRELAPELSDADARRISVVDDAPQQFNCIPRPLGSGVRSTRLVPLASGGTP